eukprot:Nitzschia sp. Nitz4//scaffold309_size21490//14165//18158//NITZ4_008611-RA/size21490-augustus-gene-0.1-mRNA-1//1//CDS//3329547180//6330//frame0
MGCNTSTPQERFPVRTETTETWDIDFRLPPAETAAYSNDRAREIPVFVDNERPEVYIPATFPPKPTPTSSEATVNGVNPAKEFMHTIPEEDIPTIYSPNDLCEKPTHQIEEDDRRLPKRGPSMRVDSGTDQPPPPKPNRGTTDQGHPNPPIPSSDMLRSKHQPRSPPSAELQRKKFPPSKPPRLDDSEPIRPMSPPSPSDVLDLPPLTASQLPPPNDDQLSRTGTFYDYFIKGELLGKGSFAEVYVCVEKRTQKKWAVKHILNRKKMIWNGRDALVDELKTMEKLRSAPYVVYMHDHFVADTFCFVVLELLPGKGLFDRLIQQGTFTEREARDSCQCILEALQYMHVHRVAHRDLKPDNILLADANRLSPVKLSDFGFSKTLTRRNDCRTVCGTPGYLAPEILERWPAYDVKVDVWSFGVVLFLLLGGYLPFDSRGDNTPRQVFERTRKGQYFFHPQRWAMISPAAKDLVARCLTINPNHRISAKEALSHPWMETQMDLPHQPISAIDLADTIERTKKTQEDHRKHNDRAQRAQDLSNIVSGLHSNSIVSHFITAPKSTRSDSSPEESLSGKPFSFFYNVGEFLGKGGFANVYRCSHKRTGLTFAVKQVDNSRLSPAEKAIVKDEVNVLKYLRGAPNIIRLYDVFLETNITYMILEEMKGGDLLGRIVEREVYTEREARQVCKALFGAVNFCHKKRIAHRDIKLDNLLLQEKGNDASLKLGDFGFSKKVGKNPLKTICGTPNYMAPEVLMARQQGYDFRCDMWSVGVVVYVLMAGYFPFEGVDAKTVATNTVNGGKVHFHPEYWMGTSNSVKRLIEGLLRKVTDGRLSAEDALQSRWILAKDDGALGAVDLSATKSKLAGLRGKKKLQAVVLGIMGANKLQAAAGVQNEIGADDTEPSVAPAETQTEADFDVEFNDVFELSEETGVGLFSKFHVATTLTSKQEFSVKKFVRRDLPPGDLVALNDEIEVLKTISDDCDDQAVAKTLAWLHEVFEDPDATYLVFEKLCGEVLLERLNRDTKFTELEAKGLIGSLLLGVSHCHSKRVAIRNLTLDNLLLPNGDEPTITITDFEFSKRVIIENTLRTQCGTLEFVAPEVLQNILAYDVHCDMWSVGVILYIMLSGYHPFHVDSNHRTGNTQEEMLKKIRYGDYAFLSKKGWGGVSYSAKALLRRMMMVNPEERIRASEALSDQWVLGNHHV